MSQNVDHLGHNGCFLVVLAEVVCSLGRSLCRTALRGLLGGSEMRVVHVSASLAQVRAHHFARNSPTCFLDHALKDAEYQRSNFKA